MNPKPMYWLTSCVCVLLAFVALAKAVPSGVHQSSSIPPRELWWAGLAVMKTSETTSTNVRIYTDRKKVSLQWRWFPDEAEEILVTDVQTFDVSYWPTHVAVFHPNSICVAGKRRTGETVIEHWEFAPPLTETTPPIPEPGGGQGEPGYSIQAGERTAVSVVYNAQNLGLDTVVQMERLRGVQEDSLMVRFWDSRDLYAVRMSDGFASLIASCSTSPPPGVLSVPALGSDSLFGLRADTHVEHGHIYVFGTGQEAQGFMKRGYEFPVICDTDRNGTLDTYYIVDEELWVAMGFSDPDNYE